jgi:hypothetical protein
MIKIPPPDPPAVTFNEALAEFPVLGDALLDAMTS